MKIVLTSTQRVELEAAVRREKQTRPWKRYRAVLLLAAGRSPAMVADTLACGVSSVYKWSATWRRDGLAGLAEGPHPGAARRVDAAGEAVLAALLDDDPHVYGHRATGWTVPLLRTELAGAGYAVSARTIRRAVHRLGYRWKRPQYVLGRPDPDYDRKKGGDRGGGGDAGGRGRGLGGR
jgi:transposase